MKRREVLKSLAGAALAGVAPRVWSQITPTEIVVGHHGPMTGPASWVGLGGRDGALLALDDINTVGVNGRKIRLIIYDDAGKPSEAEAVTRKMIQSDNVFAILGCGVSNTAIVVAEEAHRAKVPYFNGSGGSPKILDVNSRWVFSGACIDVRDIAQNEANFIAEYLKAKRVAVMAGADEFSQSLSDAVTKLIKERGIEVVIVQKYNPGDTDFSSQLLAVKSANPDQILLFGLYVEAARAVRQARELGIRTPIKGDTSMMNSGFLTVAGSAAEGMTVDYAPAYFNGDPAKDMVEFERRYKQKYPNYPTDRPNYCDAYNYGNMYAFAEGLKRAGTDPTRKSFVEALETLKEWNARDGWPNAVNIIQPLTFTESHNGNRRLSFYRVKSGKYERVDEFRAPIPSSKFPANATLKT